MKRSTLLFAAFLIDQFAGDPEWFPHPVRLIGTAINRGENAVRRPHQSPASELITGAALALTIAGSAFYLTSSTLHLARRLCKPAASGTELLLAWTCLAARNLEQEATTVTQALHAGDLPLARKRLSRIVGRDAQHLDSSEISRAVIETLAESASDGFIAPLFYMAIGGVPLAMAYKAVNTLDSMIGHADQRYFYFGKVAARLDDAANFIPARLTALLIVAAAHLTPQTSAASALQVWQADSHRHKSLNAGHPESAISGALQVALGGVNTYAGEPIPAPRIGGHLPRPNPSDCTKAIRLITVVSLLGLATAVAATALTPSRRPSR